MKTKTFYGVKFNVYTDSKIDGDFPPPWNKGKTKKDDPRVATKKKTSDRNIT